MPILEHQSALHGYTLYDEMIRIPALFVGVGVAGGGRSLESLTDTTDVHCWLRSAARGAPGCRLTPFLAAGTEPEQLEATVVMSAAASVKGGIYAIRSPRAKFVSAPQRGSRWGIGSGRGRSWRSESLFDLIRDPAERNDLSLPARRMAERPLGRSVSTGCDWTWRSGSRCRTACSRRRPATRPSTPPSSGAFVGSATSSDDRAGYWSSISRPPKSDSAKLTTNPVIRP